MNVKLAPSREGRLTRRFRDGGANRGFALVVTLSLMVLLVVIAVGLLSLSTISLRRTSSDSASITARSNARFAVMLAMGELQKSLGDDRRVTADASIFDNAANPHALVFGSRGLPSWRTIRLEHHRDMRQKRKTVLSVG